MPTDAVYETLSKRIVAQLQTITVASGYGNDIQSVQRYTQSGLRQTAVPGILVREGPEAVLEHEEVGQGNYVLLMCERTYWVILFHRQNENADARAGDEVLNSLTADVQKAMLADPTWNRLAIMTDEMGSEPLDPVDGKPALYRRVEYKVTYQRRRDDPTLAA